MEIPSLLVTSTSNLLQAHPEMTNTVSGSTQDAGLGTPGNSHSNHCGVFQFIGQTNQIITSV